MPDAITADAATATAPTTATVTATPTPATGETSPATTPATPVEKPASEATATVDPVVQELLDKAAADVEKWKKQARTNETRAKANADAQVELERLRREAMSEQEKAVADAVAAGRAEALREFGTKLVHAEFRAASAGKIAAERLDPLLDAIDLTKFVGEDGTVNVERVQAFFATIAPAAPPPPAASDDPAKGDVSTGQPPATPAPPAALPPLTPTPADIGQGAGRSTTPAPLNSDALTRAVERAVGAPRR